MAEKQLDHRHQLEHEAIKANNKAQERGIWLGFMVALLVVGGGIAIIMTGHSTTGLAAIISAMTALVAIFIYGKANQRRELSRNKPTAHGDVP